MRDGGDARLSSNRERGYRLRKEKEVKVMSPSSPLFFLFFFFTTAQREVPSGPSPAYDDAEDEEKRRSEHRGTRAFLSAFFPPSSMTASSAHSQLLLTSHFLRPTFCGDESKIIEIEGGRYR